MIPADWIPFSTSDGFVTLSLPPNWDQEDEEDDGTTAFGEDDEDAGVLRVSISVFERENDIVPHELPRVLSKRGPRPVRVGETRYLLHRVEEDEEDGEPLIQHTWEMVEQLSPRDVAIVVATYTLGRHETLTRTLEESLVGSEISIEDVEDPDDE